jgi:hypothetical protein
MIRAAEVMRAEGGKVKGLKKRPCRATHPFFWSSRRHLPGLDITGCWLVL